MKISISQIFPSYNFQSYFPERNTTNHFLCRLWEIFDVYLTYSYTSSHDLISCTKSTWHLFFEILGSYFYFKNIYGTGLRNNLNPKD